MNEHKKFFSKIGRNYLILAIIAILFQVTAGIIINIINPSLLGNTFLVTILGAICNYILPLPIILYLMNKLEKTEIEKNKVSPKKFAIYICITITLMWIGNILGTIITAVIGGLMQNEIVNPVGELINNGGMYVNIIIISIMAPIFEEFLFRKILIDRTIKYGAKISILLSALLFALFHGNLSQFFYAFLLGGFFAYIYIKTGELKYTIILHGIINFTGSIASIAFTSAMDNIVHNTNNIAATDIAIAATYLTVVIIGLMVGLYTLYKNKDINMNKIYEGTKIEEPMKTVILNTGMIYFIIYHIYIILKSTGIIHGII